MTQRDDAAGLTVVYVWKRSVDRLFDSAYYGSAKAGARCMAQGRRVVLPHAIYRRDICVSGVGRNAETVWTPGDGMGGVSGTAGVGYIS